MTRITLALPLVFSLSSAAAGHVQANAALTAVPNEAPAPAALAAPVAQRLSTEGVRVTANKATLDFWWVSALPLKAGAGAPSWGQVEEGALVGVVSLSSEYRDIRGRIIKPGVYTLRYGIQPQNGDHLGVSPYREFLLLSPAADDSDPAPRGHDGTIELSKLSIGGSHPGVWSLDPPVAQGTALQPFKTEQEHDALIMEVPVGREGKPAGSLKFGLVLIGKIEA
jgi:hypothetical protein